MTMNALLVVMLAAGTTGSATPVLPPPTPPSPLIYEPRVSQLSVANFDVDIRGGSEALWSGAMRVSNRTGARVTRSKSDAAAGDCGPANGAAVTTSLNVNLGQNYSGDRSTDAFQLGLSWERPAENGGCASRPGTRTVGLSQGLTLKPGQETVINGDGGLTVRIRRRD